ncbi:MAG: class I SAM-dependent rRNA methyltransferase [Myxococcales bacterium]
MAQDTVQVTSKGAKRLRQGMPWVFRVDVARATEAPSGAVVRVADPQGNFIGQAFWAHRSPIALRLLTRRDEKVDTAFFKARLQAALDRRQALFPGADAFRVVHGESDLLPGLIVDKFADGVTIQSISEGMASREAETVQLLDELLSPRLIALRNDTSAREFEQLPRESRLAKGQGPAAVEYHEGRNLFAIDLMEDLKTGAFLDQRENHLRAADYAKGEGLDCFTYHGGFALSLASGGCKHVIAVDQLEAAAQKAAANAGRNGLTHVEARCANAFDLLREFEKEGRRFDVVVIDPPAFAKRKEGIPAAERAYKDLNLRALKILNKEGILISCSCSGKMTPELFGRVLQSAIEDSKRNVQFLEKRAAGRDHPGFAGMPEADYLKCWVMRVV